MARRKYINPITKRILTFLLIVLVVGALAIFIYSSVYKELNPTVFNIGKRWDISFEQTILTNYDDYLLIKNEYQINSNLKQKDFSNNNYLIYFDEFDSCAEKKYKTIENINYDDGIEITLKTYNKCGFCKKDTVLYLIKIDKIETDNINFIYEYDKELECGNI